MFQTTNRVQTFDDAITSRIHLMMKYESLSLDYRRIVWESFLCETNAGLTEDELESLVQKPLNGREVRTFPFIQPLAEDLPFRLRTS